MRTPLILTLLLCTALLTAGNATASELKIYCEYAPPEKMNRDLFGGIIYEQVRELMRRTNIKTPIDVVSWKRGYTEATQWADIGLFPTTRTPEREELFHWIGPILRVTWGFYALKESNVVINSLEDAKKVKTIGIYSHDSKGQWLEKQGFTNLVTTLNAQANMKKLYGHRIDVMAGTVQTVELWPERYGLDPSQLALIYAFKNVDLYLTFSKDTSPTTIKAFKTAFADMVHDGTVRKTYQKWLPGLEPPVTPENLSQF